MESYGFGIRYSRREFLPSTSQFNRHQSKGGFQLSLEYFEFYNQFDSRMYSDKFVSTFVVAHSWWYLELPHKMVASAMQLVFEEIIKKF